MDMEIVFELTNESIDWLSMKYLTIGWFGLFIGIIIIMLMELALKIYSMRR